MSDPRNFLFNSAYGIDKVIDYLTETVTLAPGTSTVSVPTNLSETALFDGYFIVDSSSNNAPINSQYSLEPGDPVFGARVSIYVTNNNGVLSIKYSNSDASSHVVTYYIYLIAKSNQSPLEPTIGATGFVFNSSFNYLKIAQDGMTTVSAPSVTTAQVFNSTTTTIPHNLGYAPMFRGYTEYSNKLRAPGSDTSSSDSDGFTPMFSVDSTNLYITIYNIASLVDQPAKDIVCHYRIYYDS